MRFRTLAGAMALTLTVCLTVSANDGFSGGPGKSYVLIALTDNRPTEGDNGFGFQRVDLASSTFVGKPVFVWLTRTLIDFEFRKPKSMADVSVRFVGRKIAPGDYALVIRSVTRDDLPTRPRTVSCYSLGAPIYRFREGVINIVPQDEFAAQDVETLQAQVARVMSGYHGMTAPPVVAQLLGTATFKTGRGGTWFGAGCTPTRTFAFSASSASVSVVPPQP